MTAEWGFDILSAWPARPAVTPAIRLVLDFIRGTFAGPLALAELATPCGPSLHRFVAVVRNQVGLPPHPRLRLRSIAASATRATSRATSSANAA